MNNYNPFNARNSIAALLLTVLLSTTLIIGAVGPAMATTSHQSPAPVILPLA